MNYVENGSVPPDRDTLETALALVNVALGAGSPDPARGAPPIGRDIADLRSLIGTSRRAIEQADLRHNEFTLQLEQNIGDIQSVDVAATLTELSTQQTQLQASYMTLSRLSPTPMLAELAFGYLGAQLTLSYFISGWVKVVNPDWRSGRALRDVFQFSAYPVAESLRGFAHRPRLLRAMSWAVMGFELVFPLTLLWPPALAAGLVVAGTFHLANACLFGLNRFFWTWLSAYPAILWLQGRVF